VLDSRSATGALNGVLLCGLWVYCAVLLIYSRQLVGSCKVIETGWITGQGLVHLTMFFCVVGVSDGAVLLRYNRPLVGSYINGNGLEQRRGTGAIKGVPQCSEWADSAFLLRYSRQLLGSCTVTATGWVTSQLLVHLTVFVYVVSVRTVQFC